jgi:hypothetical protein
MSQGKMNKKIRTETFERRAHNTGFKIASAMCNSSSKLKLSGEKKEKKKVGQHENVFTTRSANNDGSNEKDRYHTW